MKKLLFFSILMMAVLSVNYSLKGSGVEDGDFFIFYRISSDFILTVGRVSATCNFDIPVHIQRNGK